MSLLKKSTMLIFVCNFTDTRSRLIQANNYIDETDLVNLLLPSGYLSVDN